MVNAKDLQIECARVLYQTLLVPVIMHDNERMLWKEKERSITRSAEMNNLRSLLSIRRMDSVPNTRIRKFCVDERIDEGVLRWFGHVKRMKNYIIAKRIRVGECVVIRSEGRPWKR